MRRRIVVVGGGVSGLATAWRTARAGGAVSVTLVEAGEHLGGWIRTVDAGALTGRATQPVDVGPDSMLVRSPVVRAVIADLGLTAHQREPSRAGAYIWVASGLRRLPRSSVFGIPDSALALARSGLVGRAGAARAAMDLVLPTTSRGADPSIADLLRPRLGAEVFANLVEPMLGGVHAGRAEELSARSAVPDVAALALRERSVLRAVRSLPPRTGAGPALAGFEGGMCRLVQALVDGARRAGADVRTATPVVALERGPAGDPAYRVALQDGTALEADEVVLAVPAHVAAPLLRDLDARAAGAAGAIRYADVATLTVIYDRAALTGPFALPAGTGFLVPPGQGRLLVGCTWLSSKWPQPAAASTVVIRAMVGRDGDRRLADLDDAQLERAVRAELAIAVGLPTAGGPEPLARVVRRMPQALPQYTIGHEGRLATIERSLASSAPGVHVTGAAYRGIGIAACLTSAQQLADRLVAATAG